MVQWNLDMLTLSVSRQKVNTSGTVTIPRHIWNIAKIAPKLKNVSKNGQNRDLLAKWRFFSSNLYSLFDNFSSVTRLIKKNQGYSCDKYTYNRSWQKVVMKCAFLQNLKSRIFLEHSIVKKFPCGLVPWSHTDLLGFC